MTVTPHRYVVARLDGAALGYVAVTIRERCCV
jgi:hypothetical protein